MKNFGEQLPVDPSLEEIPPAQKEVPPVQAEGERKIELDPEMKMITEQIRIENETIKPGIFAKLPEWLKKPIKVMMLAGTLGAGMGAFSQAEAGGYRDYFTGRDVIDQVVRQGASNITENMRMQQQMRYQWEQTQMNLAVQDQQMQMQRAYQREQTAQYQADQKMRDRDDAIRNEVNRYTQDIQRAKNSEEMATAKEKHNIIMEEIKNSYKNRY
jgi:hypothetical protein